MSFNLGQTLGWRMWNFQPQSKYFVIDFDNYRHDPLHESSEVTEIRFKKLEDGRNQMECDYLLMGHISDEFISRRLETVTVTYDGPIEVLYKGEKQANGTWIRPTRYTFGAKVENPYEEDNKVVQFSRSCHTKSYWGNRGCETHLGKQIITLPKMTEYVRVLSGHSSYSPTPPMSELNPNQWNDLMKNYN